MEKMRINRLKVVGDEQGSNVPIKREEEWLAEDSHPPGFAYQELKIDSELLPSIKIEKDVFHNDPEANAFQGFTPLPQTDDYIKSELILDEELLLDDKNESEANCKQHILDDQKLFGAKKRKRKQLFAQGAEAALIQLWADNIDAIRGPRKNTHIFAEMAENLAMQGWVLTANDIKSKIDNLTAKYRKVKSAIGASGGSPREWPFYGDVHRIIGTHKSNDFEVQDTIPGRSSQASVLPNSCTLRSPLRPVSPAPSSQTTESPSVYAPPSSPVPNIPSPSPLASMPCSPSPSPISSPVASSRMRPGNKDESISKLVVIYEQFGKVFENAMEEHKKFMQISQENDKERLRLMNQMTENNTRLTDGVLNFLNSQSK